MHADHVTGSGKLKQLIDGCKSVISRSSGAKADILLDPDDKVVFGRHHFVARPTPGHTNGISSYSQKFVIRYGFLTDDSCRRLYDVYHPRARYSFYRWYCVNSRMRSNGFPRRQSPNIVRISAPWNILATRSFQIIPGSRLQRYKQYSIASFWTIGCASIMLFFGCTGLTVSTVREEKLYNARLTKTLPEFIEIMENLNLPYPKQIGTVNYELCDQFSIDSNILIHQ